MLTKDKVKQWYKWGMWTTDMVKNAVVKGKLTTDDYFYITGEAYTE
jgi:uncharacterized XkdX family phage protein